MKNLSLYIHIPFCVRKCHYCDFLSASCDEETKQKYVDVLCREITQRAEEFKGKNVDTIFFGGGTPSILSTCQMEQIISALKRGFHILNDTEISMEMNPGTVDKEKLKTYKELGINRLSIGLQTANNEELKTLGRIHTWEEFLHTWEMVRKEGFSNVNIDLMSALPGQTLESYEETLRKVLSLKPEHISAYSLIIEEGTLFYKWYGEDSEKLPDEITDRKMYELTKSLLEEQGYYRYEISNYALKGYECKHNVGYWKRKEYLGLGLGAASLIFVEEPKDCRWEEEFLRFTKESENYKSGEEWICNKNNSIRNIRCSNITDLQEYLKIGKEWESKYINHINKSNENRELYLNQYTKWTEEQSLLSQKDQMEEFMFLGLRMMEGVSAEEFEKQFGRSLQEVYGTQIEKLQKQGLLQFHEESKRYALTLHGIDVSNQVFADFLF